MQRFEVLGELEGRVDLRVLAYALLILWRAAAGATRTSASSNSGGPSAMSSALVPGRIRRAAAWSRLLKNFCCSGEAGTGESWSSAIGGGLGRRGDAGEVIAVATMGGLPVSGAVSSKKKIGVCACCW